MTTLLQKDEVLDRLAEVTNVAQFVSFAPNGEQRFARINSLQPNFKFTSRAAAIRCILAAAPEGSVNVRSYQPEHPKSREFIYGLRSVGDVESAVRRLTQSGLFVIVNETINVRDGGVSGVAYGDVLEFAPDDTPRCVEKPGTLAIPRELGSKLLRTVYGFEPDLPFLRTQRVEFSVHPERRGSRREHTIVWELEDVGDAGLHATPSWPNNFSRHLGDKAFGLLLGDALGLPIPSTTVVSRRVAPFRFGRPTGTGETWIRTCPREPVPGKYSTFRGWRDPFALLMTEDPNGETLASVISQEGVDGKFSGALITSVDRSLTIEGIEGLGDTFMKGDSAPTFRVEIDSKGAVRSRTGDVPEDVLRSVRDVYGHTAEQLGAVRFEWVFDGKETWLVQLHRGASASVGRTIVPGEHANFRRFSVSRGLEELRALIASVDPEKEGIILEGEVGITSHFGDVLRRARVPSRIETPSGATW